MSGRAEQQEWMRAAVQPLRNSVRTVEEKRPTGRVGERDQRNADNQPTTVRDNAFAHLSKLGETDPAISFQNGIVGDDRAAAAAGYDL